MDKVIKKLDLFMGEIESKYPDINCGGCCVFAALIGKYLEKQGIPVRIRAASMDGDNGANLTEIRKEIRRNNIFVWENYGVEFNHVIVEFDYKGETYHCDATGVHYEDSVDPAFGWYLQDGYISVKDAAELAKAKSGWNPTFDRKLIPSLRKMVDNFFKGYKLIMNHKKRSSVRRLATS